MARIAAAIEAVAPLALAESWDRPGLQVGSLDAPVARVLIALDPIPSVVEEAVRKGADLIITHHPLFLRAPSRLDWTTPVGRIVRLLAREGLSLYSAHTNLDRAPGGVSDWLAGRLGLEEVEPLQPAPGWEGAGTGRMGTISRPEPLGEWARRAAQILGSECARLTGDPDRIVSRVAVCGGSGTSLWHEALAAGADVLVTGDLKHHTALDASAAGMAVLDLGHAPTEQGALEVMGRIVRALARAEGERLAVETWTPGEPWKPVERRERPRQQCVRR